jgi:hypothetical protein
MLFVLVQSPASAQDITWLRDGVKQMDIGLSKTAIERAESARKSLAAIGPQLTSADTLILRDEFDFGKDLPMTWPACNYVGQNATLKHQIMIDRTDVKPLGTPGFLLAVDGKSTSFTKIKFVWRCWNKEEDGGGIGWNVAGDGSVVFTDCEFDAESDCDWPIYNWTSGKKTVLILGGKAKIARWLVAAADSGADNGQNIEIRNLTATLNANGSHTYGESSNANPETGASLGLVMIRGGKATLRNVTITEAIGLTAQYDPRTPPKWGCSRIASLVTTRYYSPGQPVEILIDKFSVLKVTPNLATVWSDMDIFPTDKPTVVYDNAKIAAAKVAGVKSVAAAQAQADAGVAAARGGSNPDGSLKVLVK